MGAHPAQAEREAICIHVVCPSTSWQRTHPCLYRGTHVRSVLGSCFYFYVNCPVLQDDWNDKAVAEVSEKGNSADGQSLYAASKVLAERAIIDFTEKHKEEIGWDATRLLPAWVRLIFVHLAFGLTNIYLPRSSV